MNLTEDNVIDVLDAANFYQMNRLKLLCEQALSGGLCLENIATLLQVADTHAAFALRRVCLNFCIDHHQQLRELDSFRKLPVDLYMDILGEACQQLKTLSSAYATTEE